MAPEIWSVTDRIFLSFWTFFCPFTPPTTQKINILKKWKKTPEDIIILNMCTINDNHMINGSWDIKRDRQNILSFWTVFCPLPCFLPLTNQKIKILKNWKKHLEIWSFYTNVPKILIICYTLLHIWQVTDVTVIFHFGLFFALSPP